MDTQYGSLQKFTRATFVLVLSKSARIFNIQPEVKNEQIHLKS